MLYTIMGPKGLLATHKIRRLIVSRAWHSAFPLELRCSWVVRRPMNRTELLQGPLSAYISAAREAMRIVLVLRLSAVQSCYIRSIPALAVTA